MELVKNIFFNTDKLSPHSKIKISYTGKLFQNPETTDVYLHYGFGENWENVSDIKMEKTELGFQAEVELPENDSLLVISYTNTTPVVLLKNDFVIDLNRSWPAVSQMFKVILNFPLVNVFVLYSTPIVAMWVSGK